MKIIIGILGLILLAVAFVAFGFGATSIGIEQWGWMILSAACAVGGIILPLLAVSDIPIGHHKPSAQ